MDDKLLKRFFAGQCSKEEHEEVISWYFSGEADEDISARIAAYWETAQIKEASEDWGKEEVLGMLRESILDAEPGNNMKSKRFMLFFREYLQYAAVLMFIGLAIAGWALFTKPVAEIARDATPTFTHLRTDKGERTQHLLPDGTKAFVNAESSLWYSADYLTSAKRTVYLEGEAFFEVAEDPSRPFSVHAHNITTTALGTSFNIEAFAEEDIIVSLMTGKVKVEESLNATYLQPGEQVIYDVSTNDLTKKKLEPMSAFGWKEGILYFKNESFVDCMKKLERWYGVEIAVQKANIDDGFTGYYRNKSLHSVLEGMAFVLGFDFQVDGKRVIIK
ncbi:MAG TPA: FecR domain-containing protein [Cyclobacteriaceae bacterium]|nr:FecR domain-containing protein [Cyclobacteriaceae bacterium]